MNAGAILLAAGRGNRMGGDGNKVLLTIAGREILLHAIDAFAGISEIREIVVVTHPDDRDSIARLLESRQQLPIRMAIGGATRRDSSLAGVRASTADHVLIHDGARPFPSRDMIVRVLHELKSCAAVIPTLPQTDHTHMMQDDGRHLALREPPEGVSIARAQTPQGFHRRLILECLKAAPIECRDDAAAVLLAGGKVATVNGDPTNLKITFPEDLHLGEAIHALRHLASR